ncbi:Hypothetical predicted protein [Olea europaea subsp. europaea]|uniref:Uncharacterized protein n=1 Tax=Olea europaea subsp. europaea TaxID=158383 RepID=A0A8S0V731_OLEEU|nr:Hypothetical predicted protein [Olea europaea subsp. europaea]
MPGKGRGKGETRPSIKDDKVDSSAVKERVFTASEVFKAFSIRFVRLNGILFTRTRVSQAAAVSVPYPPFINPDAGDCYPIQTPQTALSSKFDSIISSGAAADSLYVKPSLAGSAGLKKNPVSRPVRHVGPPPGFGSVPSKFVDESTNSVSLKNENPPVPQMDDYSWLDGYQLSSSNQSLGFNHSINNSGLMFGSVSNNNNSSMGMSSFPFPGKQVSTLQIQGEKQDHQFSEHMKVYQEQQQQLQRGDKKSVALPQQYQGQPLWEGCGRGAILSAIAWLVFSVLRVLAVEQHEVASQELAELNEASEEKRRTEEILGAKSMK